LLGLALIAATFCRPVLAHADTYPRQASWTNGLGFLGASPTASCALRTASDGASFYIANNSGLTCGGGPGITYTVIGSGPEVGTTRGDFCAKPFTGCFTFE